jgi:hypothetical protein
MYLKKMSSVYDYDPSDYDLSKLRRPKWKPDTESTPKYGTSTRRNGGGNYGYTKEQEDALLKKLEERAKFTFNRELANPRTAAAYLYSKGKNPEDYNFELKDLDEDPETPDDLLIKIAKDNRLYSAGGYKMRPFTKTDKMKEMALQKYLYENYDRNARKEKLSTFRKKALKNEESVSPAIRINGKLNDFFKKWCEAKMPNFGVNCGVNGQKLKAPAYFNLLQYIHRVFKNCIAIPMVIDALGGKGGSSVGILANPTAHSALSEHIEVTSPPVDIFTKEPSDEVKEWASTAYETFKTAPRYTVWQNIINDLNNDITRFHFSLLTSPDIAIFNFISLFIEKMMLDWAGGENFPTITPKPSVPEDFMPSNLPLDFLQGIAKNKQTGGTFMQISSLDPTKYDIRKEILASRRSKVQSLLDSFRTQQIEKEGFSHQSALPLSASSSSSSSSSSSGAFPPLMFASDRTPLLTEPRGYSKLKRGRLEALLTKNNLSTEGITRMDLLNRLIANGIITKDDPVAQVKEKTPGWK